MKRKPRTILILGVLTGAFPVGVEWFQLYWLSPVLDEVGHFTGGFSVGAFTYVGLKELTFDMRSHTVLIIASVAVAAVGWEVIELSLPWVSNLGFRDTWTDILMVWLSIPVFLLFLRVWPDETSHREAIPNDSISGSSSVSIPLDD